MRSIKTFGAVAVAALAITGTAQATTTVPANDNWGDVSRNVIGASSTEYRTGPAGNPFGPQALQIDVADAASKAAFGNEVDYRGRALSTVSQFGFSVYQTGENATPNPENLPSVGVEVDPSGPADATAPNFSTLVSVPHAAPVNQWSSHVEDRYFLTGTAGTSTGCNQTTYCTLAQVQAALPNASILTVQITKGRDSGWHGSVDGLLIGSDTIDFGQPVVVGPVGPTGPGGPQGNVGQSGVNGATGVNGAAGTNGTNGTNGAAGANVPAAAGQTCTDGVRVLHAPSRTGARFLSAKATLRGKAVKVNGRTLRVDLRNRAEGNYNVRITSRYRSNKTGRAFTRTTERKLSVACA